MRLYFEAYPQYTQDTHVQDSQDTQDAQGTTIDYRVHDSVKVIGSWEKNARILKHKKTICVVEHTLCLAQ